MAENLEPTEIEKEFVKLLNAHTGMITDHSRKMTAMLADIADAQSSSNVARNQSDTLKSDLDSVRGSITKVNTRLVDSKNAEMALSERITIDIARIDTLARSRGDAVDQVFDDLVERLNIVEKFAAEQNERLAAVVVLRKRIDEVAKRLNKSHRPVQTSPPIGSRLASEM